ncbi:hypothetical protein ES708_19425 [subsurface metagenome]
MVWAVLSSSSLSHPRALFVSDVPNDISDPTFWPLASILTGVVFAAGRRCDSRPRISAASPAGICRQRFRLWLFHRPNPQNDFLVQRIRQL